ncbi:MAG: VOC family protein [bacterium]
MGEPQAQLPAETRLGAVSLAVGDLDTVASFYERALGLETLERDPAWARLGAGGEALVELVSAPDAPARPQATTGLFHLAILVEDRPALAAALRRVANADWRFTGASDHLVSEALYLRDPEGNGIEIYRDRPRADWPRSNGELQMDSLALDLEDLLAEPEPDDGASTGMPAATRMGHVHLNVADIPASEIFFVGPVGFDVTVRGYPGALFFSAGGYHHHVGVNTWAGEGAPAPPVGARGLRWFELVLPGAEAVEATAARLADAGSDPEAREDGVLVSDPSGNGILLRPA